MTFIMMFMLTMTIMFLFSNHPLTIGMILIIQTISTALITGLLTQFWFSYILFLIMIGGMLVLFLYMTSVASNLKFKFSWKLLLLSMPIAIITTIFLSLLDYMTILSLTNQSKLETIIAQYFEFPMNSIMILLVLHLLLTLIAVVKITKTNFGPLRQK